MLDLFVFDHLVNVEWMLSFLTAIVRTILTGTTVWNTGETSDIYVTDGPDFVWGFRMMH